MPARAMAVAVSFATMSGVMAAKMRGETDESGQDEHARRPEERVHDEAGDGGVEAGDRRQAGELRVGEALRDQDRCQHDPRDEVETQPRRLVGP